MIPGSLQAARGIPGGLLPASMVKAALELISRGRHVAHLLAVWFTRVESRRRMPMLSDHILRDIGLTRADVDREFMKFFWHV